MQIKELVNRWFEAWENGAFKDIPVSNHFKHTSPYGTIVGKMEYLKLVEVNKDKFLGNSFSFRDEIFDLNRACIRYTVSKGDFSMEVCEWFYTDEKVIQEIVSYYNIEGEISDSRKLSALK